MKQVYIISQPQNIQLKNVFHFFFFLFQTQTKWGGTFTFSLFRFRNDNSRINEGSVFFSSLIWVIRNY